MSMSKDVDGNGKEMGNIFDEEMKYCLRDEKEEYMESKSRIVDNNCSYLSKEDSCTT